MSTNQILNLAARAAPFVHMNAQITGRYTPDLTRDALNRLGAKVTEHTVQRVDAAIINFFV